MSAGEAHASVVVLDETGSTNAEAMTRALAGVPLPLWVRARRQTAGKGRAGRTWKSSEGNLSTSLAVALSCDALRATELSLVAGVAVIEALGSLPRTDGHDPLQRVRLKWPNDIMADDAKLGGILIETTPEFRSGKLVAIIGIGLNISNHPDIDRKTSDLCALGWHTSAEAVQDRLRPAMSRLLAVWDEGRGFSAIRSRWLAAGTPVGTPMTINAGTAPAAGTFQGIDEAGALLMRDDLGRIRRFTFGDVTLASAVAAKD